MRILTVRQPWAWFIAQGLKTIENRGRPTPYRGVLAIHAAKTIRVAECRSLLRWALHLGWITEEQAPTIDELRAQAGRIVAVARLVGVVPAEKMPVGAPWVMGRGDPDACCWMLEDAVALEQPLLCAGRQGGPCRMTDVEVAAVELGLARQAEAS
jgi:hypothetical protein